MSPPRLPLLSKRNLISTISKGRSPAPAPETLCDVISRAFPFICQPSLTELVHLLMWRHWQISSIYLCDVIDKSVPFIFVTSLRGLFHSPLWHCIAFCLSINSLWIRMWYRRFKVNVSGFLKLSLWSFLKGTRTGTRNPSAGTGTALDIPRRKNMGQTSQEEHGTDIAGRTWDKPQWDLRWLNTRFINSNKITSSNLVSMGPVDQLTGFIELCISHKCSGRTIMFLYTADKSKRAFCSRGQHAVLDFLKTLPT